MADIDENHFGCDRCFVWGLTLRQRRIALRAAPAPNWELNRFATHVPPGRFVASESSPQWSGKTGHLTAMYLL
jgi:hypothetical protein